MNFQIAQTESETIAREWLANHNADLEFIKGTSVTLTAVENVTKMHANRHQSAVELGDWVSVGILAFALVLALESIAD